MGSLAAAGAAGAPPLKGKALKWCADASLKGYAYPTVFFKSAPIPATNFVNTVQPDLERPGFRHARRAADAGSDQGPGGGGNTGAVRRHGVAKSFLHQRAADGGGHPGPSGAGRVRWLERAYATGVVPEYVNGAGWFLPLCRCFASEGP